MSTYGMAVFCDADACAHNRYGQCTEAVLDIRRRLCAHFEEATDATHDNQGHEVADVEADA